MILIDTSAWIEFLRDTDSAVCRRVDALLPDDIATCHPVRMAVLAGARDERHLNDLGRLAARAALLPTRATDYEQAATLYRTCRRGGETVRKLIDCLIAATAIRAASPCCTPTQTSTPSLARRRCASTAPKARSERDRLIGGGLTAVNSSFGPAGWGRRERKP